MVCLAGGPTTACNVVVIGAGPAGSAVANLCAAWGRSVLVLSTAGRIARGLAESLPPSTRKLFATVGVLDSVQRAGFYRTTDNTVWWASPTVAPVPLESKLGALSVLVARGVLELVPLPPSTKLFPTRDASDDHPSTGYSGPRRSEHTGRAQAALGCASDPAAWSDRFDAWWPLSDKIVDITGRARNRFVTFRPRTDDACAGSAEMSPEKGEFSPIRCVWIASW
jgi:hypothetical protein